MPIIVSEAIVNMQPAFTWMGGGHPLLKLGVSTEELAVQPGVIVADISVPRLGITEDETQGPPCQYP